MINDLIYVYCVSEKPVDRLPELESIKLETLPFGNFQVFFKYVAENEFSEENFKRQISNTQWLESNAREHFRIISVIMKYCDVIPFKFGTIYTSDASLGKFITEYSDSLSENFQFIRGKEEWAVKIYCDRKILFGKIDELSEDAATMESQIMASSPGKAYLLKRKKMDLAECEMDRLCHIHGQQYFDELKNLSESICLNNLLPKEFTGREDTMILNASFLLRKCKVTDFVITVLVLRKKNETFGFCIEASGPWPPFNFIAIKEKQ